MKGGGETSKIAVIQASWISLQEKKMGEGFCEKNANL
jgi:hypothetical protein